MTLRDGSRKAFYGRTRQEVARRLAEAIRDREKGVPQRADERQTVRVFLDQWLADKRPSVAPRTLIRYREFMQRASQAFGDYQLTRVTPAMIQRLCSALMADGPHGPQFTSSTAHYFLSVLKQAFEAAVQQGLIVVNPADRVVSPKIIQTEMHPLDPAQAVRLLKAARGDRLEALYILALSTGMRQGEILALHWRDIDIERATLQVRGTLSYIRREGLRIGPPKTKRSRRLLDLSPNAVAALQRHRERQAHEQENPAWDRETWPDLVFPNTVGRPILANNLMYRSFKPLLKKAELPEIRFHDLRHTAATLMLLEGTSPKVVSERLGHANISITLDRYSHVLPGMQRDAALALDRILFPDD